MMSATGGIDWLVSGVSESEGVSCWDINQVLKGHSQGLQRISIPHYLC